MRDTDSNPIGTFRVPSDVDLKTMECDSTDDSVTHSINTDKNETTFTWIAPENEAGDLQLRYIYSIIV